MAAWNFLVAIILLTGVASSIDVPCDKCKSTTFMVKARMVISNFQFWDLSSTLRDGCALSTGIVDSCKQSSCSQRIKEDFLAFCPIFEYVCSKAQAFEDTSSCWNSNFEASMRRCINQPSTSSDKLKTCFKETIEALPNCSDEAEKLFIQLSTMVLDAAPKH